MLTTDSLPPAAYGQYPSPVTRVANLDRQTLSSQTQILRTLACCQLLQVSYRIAVADSRSNAEFRTLFATAQDVSKDHPGNKDGSKQVGNQADGQGHGKKPN